MTRRFVVAAAAFVVSLAAGAALGGKDDASAAYSKDVDFLLENFEKKAGHFFKQKGVDWAAVTKEFRAAAKTVKTDGDHVKLCARLVARLRDGHACVTDVKCACPDDSKGRKFTGPRVHLLMVGDKVYVRAAFGEAEQQGVKPGMEVTQIDETPAKKWLDKKVVELTERFDYLQFHGGYSSDRGAVYAACHLGLADWSGTNVKFEIVERGSKRTFNIARNGGPNFSAEGLVFPPKDAKELGRDTYGRTAAGFGYVHLHDAPGELPEQLDQMLDAIGDVKGFVLDLRANVVGGCDHDAVFGRFLATGKRFAEYVGAGKRPFAGPMAVIVDAGTASTGETVAGMFKETGRAWLIGPEPTHGMSSQKETLPVPSKLFSAYFAVASNKQSYNGGRGIEGIGIAPNEVVAYDPAELLAGVDTQIRRADELLKDGLKGAKLLYKPPEEK